LCRNRQIPALSRTVIKPMRTPQIKRPMVGRDVSESHRVSTPLELLFDLCFVVAASQAVAGLHHFAVEGNFQDGIQRYAVSFFAIWWAWVNFSWFASAFDTDDIAYRLAVLVQIGGNLTIAAGIPRYFDHMDPTVTVIGYVIMRLGLVGLWMRVAQSNPEAASVARRYAFGVTLGQIGWVALLILPGANVIPVIVALALLELLVPIWAERRDQTPWHAGHIAERYGLFTLIVLGESILGATVSIQSALDIGEELATLLLIAAGGLLIVFSMWWLYFDQPTDVSLLRFREGSGAFRDKPFIFGYGHIFVFASAAAVGGGIELAVDYATHHTHITGHQASAMIAIPVALYLVCIWALRLMVNQCPPRKSRLYLTAIILVLATIVLTNPVLPIGLICAALVAGLVLIRFSQDGAESGLL
jgi:low temperature requirement protein LtrA